LNFTPGRAEYEEAFVDYDCRRLVAGGNTNSNAGNQPSANTAQPSNSQTPWRCALSPMKPIGKRRRCASIAISSATTEPMWSNRASARSSKRSSEIDQKAAFGPPFSSARGGPSRRLKSLQAFPASQRICRASRRLSAEHRLVSWPRSAQPRAAMRVLFPKPPTPRLPDPIWIAGLSYPTPCPPQGKALSAWLSVRHSTLKPGAKPEEIAAPIGTQRAAEFRSPLNFKRRRFVRNKT
jgi:hypothetical protein